MEFEKWIHGFKTIYEGIWVGITKDVTSFKESEHSYIAELKNGNQYVLNKIDAHQIESFLSDKPTITFLFGVEKQTGTCTELLMEFQFHTEEHYRVLASYGLEGKKEVRLYEWGREDLPYTDVIAKEVCSILLVRPGIKEQHESGTLSYHYHGILSELHFT